MEKISIIVLSLFLLAGCEATKTHEHYYTKSVAGSPVYDQDYRLTAANH